MEGGKSRDSNSRRSRGKQGTRKKIPGIVNTKKLRTSDKKKGKKGDDEGRRMKRRMNEEGAGKAISEEGTGVK